MSLRYLLNKKFAMSGTYMAGENKKMVKNNQNILIFFRLLAVFLSFKGKGDPKKIKKNIFNYFLLYLIAITVIIAL
jgi:hypothetical protein